MSTWFAEFEAARFHFANPKFLADQMIERHPARDDVAPAGAEIVFDLELAAQGLDRLSFNQSEFTIGLRFVIGALTEKIAIAFQASTRNRAHFVDGLHRPFRFGCDVD